MKISLVLLVVVSGWISGAPTGNTEKKEIFNDWFVSSYSVKKYYIIDNFFFCHKRSEIETIKNTLIKASSLLPDYECKYTSKTFESCAIEIKVPFDIDCKPIYENDLKEKIVNNFHSLLNVLAEKNMIGLFFLNNNSFIYDPKRNKVLFSDIQLIEPSKVNASSFKKLNWETKKDFIDSMKKRLDIYLKTLDMSYFQYDVEVENFELKSYRFFEKSWIEVFQPYYSSKESKEPTKFPAKLEISAEEVDSKKIKVTIKHKNDNKIYYFNKDKDIFSIYICQHMNVLKKSDECINLTEQDQVNGSGFVFDIADNLMYEVTKKAVPRLKLYSDRNYFKVFVTLMREYAREIVIEADSETNNSPRSDLQLEYYLEYDSESVLRLYSTNSSKNSLTFKLNERPLKIAKDIQISKISDPKAEAEKSKIFNFRKENKYYKLKVLNTKTLIIKDQTDDKPAEILYVDSLITDIPIIKSCTNPYPNLHYRFENGLSKLSFLDEEKTYKNSVNIYPKSKYFEPMKRCIELEGTSNYRISFETQTEYNNLKFTWSYNSGHNLVLSKKSPFDIVLSEENIEIPKFEFKNFEYPEIEAEMILIFVKKMETEEKFRIQGLYYNKQKNDWIFILPEKKTLFLKEVPKIVSVNTNGGFFFFKKLKDTNLIDLPVNYLSNDEIIYKFKNYCNDGRKPILETSSDKNIIEIDCTILSPKFLSFKDLDIKQNSITKGLEVVARELNFLLRLLI